VRTRALPAPIPYQGSKRRLAAAILECFPADVGVLHEPFCGSAAVTIAALARGRAGTARMNDANEPLVRLWDAVLADPAALAERYDRLWRAQLGRERAFYDEVRDRFNRSHEPHLLLFLLARCVKAAVRYNTNGAFNQSPDNRRRGTKPDRMADHLARSSAILRGRTRVSALDHRQALTDAGPADLVYLDPPYQGVSAARDRRYRRGLALERFVATLEDLNRREISYVVSYDGRTGGKRHGMVLPDSLGLGHFELDGGRSSQETLLGRDGRTVESLYLSPALLARLGRPPSHLHPSCAGAAG
jgi:DNA adenine methylase